MMMARSLSNSNMLIDSPHVGRVGSVLMHHSDSSGEQPHITSSRSAQYISGASQSEYAASTSVSLIDHQYPHHQSHQQILEAKREVLPDDEAAVSSTAVNGSVENGHCSSEGLNFKARVLKQNGSQIFAGKEGSGAV